MNTKGQGTCFLGPSNASCVSRESQDHLDRQDLKALEVSRGHRGPRAAQYRDPW